ncbi:MAG: Npt1/Npt2 family nucleotide transporter [bacterium]
MNRFLSVFNFKDDEKRRAGFLFIYQFLAVAVMVQGRIVRDTLFLKRYDTSKLSLMYIGVALLVSTATYIYIKRSFFYRLDKLIVGTFLIGIITTLIFVFLVKADIKMSFPALYIFIELLGAFMMFQFWSFTNELIDSREAKRVLGFIGGGGIVATLVVGGSIKQFVNFMPVENLLIVNTVFMGICMNIVKSMGTKYQMRLQRGVVAKTATKLTGKAQVSIFKSPYVKYIAIMTAFIFVVTTLVDYQFKIVAGRNFSEKELASFFGMVYAIFGGVFSLFFQFIATSRLLRWSVFASLGVLPVMMTIFSCFFIALPETLILFSWSAPLIAITMAKASDYAFRYTVNDAAVQLLYIPLDPKIKSRAKALIDGIIKPIFIGISGLILYIIGVAGVNEKAITWFVVIIGIIWLVVILTIRKEYLSVLIDNIKKKRFGTGDFAVKQNVLENIVNKAIESGDEEEVMMALDMVEKSNLFYLGRSFIPFLGNSSSRVKVKILAMLRSMESRFYAYEILKLLKDEDDDVVKEAVLTYGYAQMEKSISHLSQFLESENIAVKRSAVIALIKFGGVSGVMVAAPYLKEFTDSEDEIKRYSAAYILGEIGQKNMQQQLFNLLNDPSPNVRREAVKAASKVGSDIFVPKLFYMLFDKNVSFDVSKVLTQFGEKVIPPSADILTNSLESYRLKSEVAKMLGDLYIPQSVHLLMNTLDTKSDEMRNIILDSLKKLIAKVENVSLNVDELRNMLFKEMFQYFQLLYFSVKIRERLTTRHLSTVLETKLQNCYQRIFSILSLMYGNTLFDNIYFNITQKFVSNAQRSNAIEIIDNMVDKDLRTIIIPLIEMKDEVEKLRLGFSFFKIKRINFAETMETFLVDDSEWVRSITLYVIAIENIFEFAEKIEMFLYDPSPIVRETALYAMETMGIKISEEDIKILSDDPDKLLSNFAKYIAQPKNRRTTMILDD